MAIPIIDLFAGPGGLGEGFSTLIHRNKRVFKIALSIEKDKFAHQTLTLRSFYRQFSKDKIPNDYYDVLQGNMSTQKLFEKWPKEAKLAKEEAWRAKLGYDQESAKPKEVDRMIKKALKGSKNWVLIGGPPCQAYSVVGRSRRKDKILDPEKDERVDLYRQYLRILAVHNPTVFVMENVKGMLSAKMKESPVFKRILHDLKDPVSEYKLENPEDSRKMTCPGYKIYSLVERSRGGDLYEDPVFNQEDFIIRCEDYGIPQTRHRVILLGIRKNLDIEPDIIEKHEYVPISMVLDGLPRLRSGLSKIENNDDNWKRVISQITEKLFFKEMDKSVAERIEKVVQNIKLPQKKSGEEFIYASVSSKHKPDWYLDNKIKGVCNHVSRGHMESDLYRYMFVSSFGKEYKKSPKLQDFPQKLLPNHQNVGEALKNKKFADRFRVQLENEPAKTITSHISKDGHYYIHPDPSQCRSLTVREAARIQTFPDNYFFCGPRTSQYHQVGNAVPPLLAYKISKIVREVFRGIRNEGIPNQVKQEV